MAVCIGYPREWRKPTDKQAGIDQQRPTQVAVRSNPTMHNATGWPGEPDPCGSIPQRRGTGLSTGPRPLNRLWILNPEGISPAARMGVPAWKCPTGHVATNTPTLPGRISKPNASGKRSSIGHGTRIL